MSHYSVHNSIKSIDDLRSIFPDGKANALNWCFFSTSGVHGTYSTIQDCLDDGDSLTVLVLRPRMCFISYGNIHIKPEDEAWLRNLAASTLKEIGECVAENLPEPHPRDPLEPQQCRK